MLELRATRKAHLLALFVVFPANFALATLGAGFPTIMAINTPDPSPAVMWGAGVVSIAFAATALWWTSQLLLRQQAQTSGAEPLADRARVDSGHSDDRASGVAAQTTPASA